MRRTQKKATAEETARKPLPPPARGRPCLADRQADNAVEPTGPGCPNNVVDPTGPRTSTDRRRFSPTDLDRPLQFEKGVGPRRAEVLARIGLRTARDMLLHCPRRYEDRTRLVRLAELEEGVEATVRARVVKVRTGRPRGRSRGRGPMILTARLEDDTGSIDAVWFNQRYLAETLREGTDMVITGKPRVYRSRLQLAPREYEILSLGEGTMPLFADETTDPPERGVTPAQLAAGRIVPFYPLTEGVSQRFMRMLAYTIVSTTADSFPEILPGELREKRRLPPMPDALREMHFPSTMGAREAARRRLAYEELFVLQTGLALLRARAKREPGRVFEIPPEIDRRIRRRLPFELTQAQNRAVEDISADLASAQPMNRLLQGDVGSGKTAVAVYSMLAVVARGAQAAVMAPTELLAAQHARTLSRFLKGSRVNVAMVTGSLDPAAKREAREDVACGRAQVAVGTHALIEEKVQFNDLGLVVMDEQHKFGVMQRSRLKKKGPNPHVLVMTATPIPRTLALAYFGDLDLSIIDELPPGRGGCVTRVVKERGRTKAYREVARAVRAGRQAYVVCPRVAGDGILDDFDLEEGPDIIRSATETRERLERGPLKGLRLGLLHGRMPPEDKDGAMRDFLAGRTQVLVSTVVIEVGIDVPNATVLVVEHAERFGLAQLHQLRGRVSRGSYRGEVYLMADPKTEGAVERLKALEETTDGFKISEVDFRIRGPGEFFGTRQSGLPELRFADILSDTGILKEAREDAFGLVEADPRLAAAELAGLRQRVRKVFRGRLGLGAVG